MTAILQEIVRTFERLRAAATEASRSMYAFAEDDCQHDEESR